MRDTWPQLARSEFPAIERGRITTLQLNLGYRCNLSCIHCHVNAGPRRTETMDRETMQLALEVGARLGVGILDLTGGSPEMNADFRWLVETAKARGLHVMDRLNPTIMQEPGYANINYGLLFLIYCVQQKQQSNRHLSSCTHFPLDG